MSLASLAMYPPPAVKSENGDAPDFTSAYKFLPFDPLLNARVDTVEWARRHIPAMKET